MPQSNLPNYDGIQFQDIRTVVDPKFIDTAKRLEVCYYHFWKNGESQPFVVGSKTYDVQPTAELSKALFDKLHGLVWHYHTLALAEENKKLGKYRQDKVEGHIKDTTGQKVDSLVDVALRQIALLQQEGIEVEV